MVDFDDRKASLVAQREDSTLDPDLHLAAQWINFTSSPPPLDAESFVTLLRCPSPDPVTLQPRSESLRAVPQLTVETEIQSPTDESLREALQRSLMVIGTVGPDGIDGLDRRTQIGKELIGEIFKGPEGLQRLVNAFLESRQLKNPGIDMRDPSQLAVAQQLLDKLKSKEPLPAVTVRAANEKVYRIAYDDIAGYFQELASKNALHRRSA